MSYNPKTILTHYSRKLCFTTLKEASGFNLTIRQSDLKVEWEISYVSLVNVVEATSTHRKQWFPQVFVTYQTVYTPSTTYLCQVGVLSWQYAKVLNCWCVYWDYYYGRRVHNRFPIVYNELIFRHLTMGRDSLLNGLPLCTIISISCQLSGYVPLSVR